MDFTPDMKVHVLCSVYAGLYGLRTWQDVYTYNLSGSLHATIVNSLGQGVPLEAL